MEVEIKEEIVREQEEGIDGKQHTKKLKKGEEENTMMMIMMIKKKRKKKENEEDEEEYDVDKEKDRV